MLKDVYLKNMYTNEYMNEIYNLMENEEGIKEIFHGKQDRISSSVAACLIKKEEITIGFFLLTTENLNNVLFLDVGIKKEYRSKGIGKAICSEIIKQKISNEFIIAETRKDNVAANDSIRFQSSLVYSINNLNYYLLDKDRLQEFLESPTYIEFIKYCDSEKPKQYEYIKKIMDKK